MNKQSIFLKECIADAYIQLLEENANQKISAQTIAKKAGVGRATYFRHFKTREDIIVFKLKSLWNDWAKEQLKKSYKQVQYQDTLDFFEFNYTIRDLHKIIYNANMQHAIYAMLYDVMIGIDTDNHLDCYMNRFYSYGLFGILDEWIQSEYKETPSELAKFVEDHIL